MKRSSKTNKYTYVGKRHEVSASIGHPMSCVKSGSLRPYSANKFQDLSGIISHGFFHGVISLGGLKPFPETTHEAVI